MLFQNTWFKLLFLRLSYYDNNIIFISSTIFTTKTYGYYFSQQNTINLYGIYDILLKFHGI